MITVSLRGYLRPSGMFNLARGHGALQLSVVSQRTSPALQGWHKRQQFASGLVVAERNRAYVGHTGQRASRRSPPLEFHLAASLSRIPQNNSSPWNSLGAIPNHHLAVSIDRARDLRSQRRGRWKLLKSMVRHEKSARLTQFFHDSSERLQSFVARAALRGGGAAVRRPLSRVH